MCPAKRGGRKGGKGGNGTPVTLNGHLVNIHPSPTLATLFFYFELPWVVTCPQSANTPPKDKSQETYDRVLLHIRHMLIKLQALNVVTSMFSICICSKPLDDSYYTRWLAKPPSRQQGGLAG